MSWLKHMATGEEPPRYVDKETDKIQDPSQPGRMVSNKKANQPFLAYKEFRSKQEALHKEWLEKKKEYDAKVARGEKPPPIGPDPTAVEEVGLLGLLKFIGVILLCIALAGKFFTGSFLWEYDGKWVQLKTYMPSNGGQRLFSEAGLATFNGQDGKPLYLAIDGEVYDVSKGKAYQPGGSYHHFVGLDAARAFGTGCFATHKTHDLRGLTDKELAGVEHWKKFYAEHKDYFKVGHVNHPPIDPKSPIPEHCDPKRAAQEKEEAKARKKAEKHDEL